MQHLGHYLVQLHSYVFRTWFLTQQDLMYHNSRLVELDYDRYLLYKHKKKFVYFSINDLMIEFYDSQIPEHIKSNCFKYLVRSKATSNTPFPLACFPLEVSCTRSWFCQRQKAFNISEADILSLFFGANDSSSFRIISLTTANWIRFPKLGCLYIIDTCYGIKWSKDILQPHHGGW